MTRGPESCSVQRWSGVAVAHVGGWSERSGSGGMQRTICEAQLGPVLQGFFV